MPAIGLRFCPLCWKVFEPTSKKQATCGCEALRPKVYGSYCVVCHKYEERSKPFRYCSPECRALDRNRTRRKGEKPSTVAADSWGDMWEGHGNDASYNPFN